jgi:hypothetical protein
MYHAAETRQGFTIDLSLKMLYDQVTAALGRKIDRPHMNIRLTSYSMYAAISSPPISICTLTPTATPSLPLPLDAIVWLIFLQVRIRTRTGPDHAEKQSHSRGHARPRSSCVLSTHAVFTSAVSILSPSAILYYEELDFPVTELENKKQVSYRCP